MFVCLKVVVVRLLVGLLLQGVVISNWFENRSKGFVNSIKLDQGDCLGCLEWFDDVINCPSTLFYRLISEGLAKF